MTNKFKYKLFGRFRGRKRKQVLNKDATKEYKINIDKDLKTSNYNILDIGSGSGENAIFLSKLYPKAKIITCEIFEDGNINLENTIVKNKIKNIKLYKGNVLEFLDITDQNFYFSQIWILFPDPWPKLRHHKRRLINSDFLKTIYLYLKKDGKIFIATDSKSYSHSILNIIYSMQDIFLWKNQRKFDWDYANLNVPKTKFFKKAENSGRNSIIFELIKI